MHICKMSVLEWKRINLFNLTLFADYNRLQNIKSLITTQCHNSQIRIFCDDLGSVHVFFRSTAFKELMSYKAHSNSIKLCSVTNENVLVTLEQEDKRGIFLQLFNINKMTKRNGAPCIGACELSAVSAATVVRICSVDSQIIIAIGFQSGDIILHRAPVIKDLAYNFKPLTVGMRSIIGIEFLQRDPLSCNMFICSDTGVFCYTITGNNTISETKVALDTTTASSQCCTLYTGLTGEAYFTVGRDDAVYCFTTDGRGPCYAIKGKKNCLAWFGNNLIILINPSNTKLFGQMQNSVLIVIDVFDKMIVFCKSVKSVSNIIVENESTCHIVMKTNEVFVLRERDQQRKMHMLVSKNMYDTALRMLEHSNNDHANKAYVYMNYGNYLQLRGQYGEAVEKYIKTIGAIDPYYVIRQLLYSRDNKYLAQYLRKLVQSEYGTEDHKALLRSCNEHLNLRENIEQMYLHLDNSCAINLYDGLSSSNAALININDRCKNSHSISSLLYDKQLVCQFFAQMTHDETYQFLVEHAKITSDQNSQMIEIFKILWTDQFNSSLNFVKRVLPLLINTPESCIVFLEYIIRSSKECGGNLYNTLLQLYLNIWCSGQMKANELLDFLKAAEGQLSVEHVLTLFRNHSFWPGILVVYENYKLLHLCVRYLIRNSNSKFYLLLPQTFCYSEQSLDMWIQAFNKGNLLLDSSSMHMNHMNHWLSTMLLENYQSHLQVLKNISGNKVLRILHIKDFFNQKYLQKLTVSNHHRKICKNLQDGLQKLRTLLLSYFLNPIEFRSNTCDICKQQLKLPAVFFICQHSFHKECASAYSKNEGCITCLGKKSYKFDTIHSTHSKHLEKEAFDLVSSKDLMANVSTFLSGNEFKQSTADVIYGINEVKLMGPAAMIAKDQSGAQDPKQWLGRFSVNHNLYDKRSAGSHNPTTDPFIDTEYEMSETSSGNPSHEYDANLNPFHKESP